MKLTAAARCHGCPWTAAGDPDATWKACNGHAAPGHPVAIVTTWEAR